MRDIVATFEIKGKPIPEEYLEPVVLDGYAGWVDAFYELSTDRQMGAGIGPIPAKSIREYTADWPDEDERELFRRAIRSMDTAFMAVLNKNEDGGDTSQEPADIMDVRAALRGD